ncbi:hypothetical protein EJ02DRAFT_347579 [Clathrospora elynae]|uniref:Uncharacterized protein n=1 Tax=Clathrospora elynae TaxID=706981 RepID=A0A6A5SPX3_9PLEO|nr:hypothetical protein EJ02DRAFT_347579 [Clathrospora elynae]
MNNGVRNLRAMFEGSAASSPEPRGRSPVDYMSAQDSDTRPTSKVRASFVPVEPPTSAPAATSTDLGTTKGAASNSSAAHRRESFRESQDNTDELTELRRVVSEEKEERRKSVSIPEAVPEQAVASRESSVPASLIRDVTEEEMPNLGSIMKGSDFPDASTGAEDVKRPEVPEPATETVEPSEQSPEETATPSTEPITEPAPTPAEPVETPADNPDKVVTGVQEEVALRPAAPTDEAALSGETALSDEVAISDDEAPSREAAISDEAAPADEATIPDESTPSDEAAALAPAERVPSDETPVAAETDSTNDAPTLAGSSTEPKVEIPRPAAGKAKANGIPVSKKPELKKPAAISTAKPSSKTPASAKSPLPKPPRTPTAPKPKMAVPAAKPSPAAKVQPKSVAQPKAAAQPKPAAPKEPIKAPVTKAPVAKKTSRTSLRPAASSSSATVPTASAAAKPKATAPHAENKKPAATKPVAPRARYVYTSPTGFKKPRPKSPTRPVGLPSRLIAPTAASAAKHGEEPKVTRKPSTTTRPASKAAVGRPSRPSVAPSAAPKRPESRTSMTGAPKGGFLERMMRPTAASSGKTHDKPASPPHKTATATKPGVLQKGKNKVEEVASKAKEAVTNGNHDYEPKADDEAVTVSGATDDAAESATANETSHEPTKAATPVQDVDSSVVELQTPNFQGETLR